MYGNHEDSLDEQRVAKVCAKPIEDFENACNEHDERDIEGEAGGAARAVHRVDLIAIAGDGARGDAGDTRLSAHATSNGKSRRDIQYWRNVLHDIIDKAHVCPPWVTVVRSVVIEHGVGSFGRPQTL